MIQAVIKVQITVTNAHAGCNILQQHISMHSVNG